MIFCDGVGVRKRPMTFRYSFYKIKYLFVSGGDDPVKKKRSGSGRDTMVLVTVRILVMVVSEKTGGGRRFGEK